MYLVQRRIRTIPVSTTWTSPAAGGALDLATGAILTETWCDGVASDLLRLGGTNGQVTQTILSTFTGAISTVSAAFVTTTDSVALTTTGTGDVLVFAFGSFANNTAGNSNSLAIQQDAGGYTEVANAFSPVGGYNFMLVGAIKFAVPSAAAHTYNTGWRVSTGTGTLSQGSSPRCILAVELKR